MEFIFLIDEWDCVMRERQQSEDLHKRYLDFLQNLLKDQPYVAMAYMTGILPVKKYGPLSTEYVQGIFYDQSKNIGRIYWFYRGGSKRAVPAF